MIPSSPITREDIFRAQDILGTNQGTLMGNNKGVMKYIQTIKETVHLILCIEIYTAYTKDFYLIVYSALIKYMRKCN